MKDIAAKILAQTKSVLSKVLRAVLAAVKNNPPLFVGFIASGVVAVAGHYHIVIDKASAVTLLTPIVTGLVAQFYTVPTKTAIKAEKQAAATGETQLDKAAKKIKNPKVVTHHHNKFTGKPADITQQTFER